MQKKTAFGIVTAVVIAVIALAAHLAGGDILATARQHLRGMGR